MEYRKGINNSFIDMKKILYILIFICYQSIAGTITTTPTVIFTATSDTTIKIYFEYIGTPPLLILKIDTADISFDLNYFMGGNGLKEVFVPRGLNVYCSVSTGTITYLLYQRDAATLINFTADQTLADNLARKNRRLARKDAALSYILSFTTNAQYQSVLTTLTYHLALYEYGDVDLISYLNSSGLYLLNGFAQQAFGTGAAGVTRKARLLNILN